MYFEGVVLEYVDCISLALIRNRWWILYECG